jgi:PTH2 family peptidyl-tRNA hydrolase
VTRTYLSADAQDKAGAWDTTDFRYKLAIAVRRDLDMGKGKIAVQVGHASITAAEETRRHRPEWWKGWFNEGQCKVVVKVNSESELQDLEKKAHELGLASAIVHDRGLTQVEPGTATCIGIGPAPAELVDKITRMLPLL